MVALGPFADRLDCANRVKTRHFRSRVTMGRPAQSAADKLRSGELSFDEALALLASRHPAARELAAELGRRAQGEQVGALLSIAGQVDAQTPFMFLASGVACRLLERGLWREVVAHPWAFPQLVAFGPRAAESLPVDDRRVFFARVAERLLQGCERGEVRTLTLLGAKYFIEYLEDSVRGRLLAWLEPRVRAENDAGEYQELDYAYGQVDPLIELSMCFARADRAERAVACLEQRDRSGPEMMHWTELLDLAAVSDALPEGLRARWWPRLRVWARATDESGHGEEGESLETEWLLRARPPHGTDVEPGLLELVTDAPLPQRLRGVLALSASGRLRDRARARLVEMIAAMVADLVAGSKERYRVIRAIRSAAGTVGAVARELTDVEHRTVGDAARAWASWFAGYQTRDWLDHQQTAIGFAGAWRAEIEAAAARLRGQVARGDEHLLACEGWERLFSDEDLRALRDRRVRGSRE